MDRAIMRMISMAAPMIHRSIVNTLANNFVFQRMAWHGTEAAKKAGKEGGDAVRNSAAFRAAQYKAMEAQARMKDTEAFKHLEASGAFKTAGEVKDKVLRELKQVRDGVRDGLR